ncbi:MAG: hypothetical protein KF691_04795 [Phycisphaeraceae bacterium]|nr:hypothetical protein [Phycisphaeraceae bacterium]
MSSHEPHGHADAWHHHTLAEGIPQHEHAATVNTTNTFVVLLVIFGFTAVFILVTVLYFNVTVRQVQEARVETIGGAQLYNVMKSQMETDLSTFGVVDPATKTVRIPVDRAIDRVVKRYQQR